MAQLLLQNGTVLIHDQNEDVKAVRTNILIQGNKIAQIGTDISAPDATVINCTDKIISPGFIDTHHHVWQTQLKGRHANHTLMQYMPSGNFTAFLYKAEDVFWGQLGGLLEMLDGGTTAVVDYAHISMSPEHNYSAISATVASGIRSSYGFAPNPRLKSTNPFEVDPNGLGGHSLDTFDQLAKQSPWGNGRVTLGFAFDGWVFLPPDYASMLLAKVNEYKIPVIQYHVTWRPGRDSWSRMLAEKGILDSRFLASHSNMSKEDADLFREKGVHYSSTPSTELQMSMGLPVTAYRDDLDIYEMGSLGVDCHSNNAAFLPGEARLGLQSARAWIGESAASRGKVPQNVGPTVQSAFNLATIRGAHAMKLADQIGSIAEGKLADLVIFDAKSPAMVCAADHDPVAAVVLHSSPADVDTVIVDGIVRKQGGKLLEVKVDDEVGRKVAGKEPLGWKDVAGQLVRSRQRIQGETEKMDMEDGEAKVKQMFGLKPDDFE